MAPEENHDAWKGVSYRHLSNCSQICGWNQHTPNSGIDTLSLKWEF